MDLGEQSEELLQRCILANCRFSIRVPEPASGSPSNPESDGLALQKLTMNYDLPQVLANIEELFLENRALISYRVSFFDFREHFIDYREISGMKNRFGFMHSYRFPR